MNCKLFGAAACFALGVSATAQAACTQTNAAGTWAAYSAGTTGGDLYWFRCTLTINGETVVRRVTDPNTGKTAEIQDPAFPVIIPAKEEQVAEDPNLRKQAENLGVLQSHPNAPRPGAGRLKSLNDN